MKLSKQVLYTAFLLVMVTNVPAVDVYVSGFVRQEIAAKVTDDDNPFNQQGNVYNGVTVNRNSTVFGASTATRTNPLSDNDYDFNYFVTRVEIDTEVMVNDNWSAYAKLRALGNWDGPYGGLGGSIFTSTTFNNNRGTMIESNHDSYMIDFPSLYVDYTNGPLWLRLGNQQIAWGESLFFRVLDVPNGLDLRRHLILDYAAEEYSDERVPAPALRGSFTLDSGWELEGFVQMSNPTILPNPNTPYNVIPDQFVVDHGNTRGRWNFGGRARGQVGEVDLQFIGVSRVNPDGVIRWSTASGAGTIAGTSFQGSTSGVISAAEWFDYAARARLNGVTGLNSSLNDFPAALATAGLFGLGPVGATDIGGASNILDTFFTAVGPLRGHLERQYMREEVFGAGLNYVVHGKPDSFLDQLILRAEMTYTPDKVFTDPSLRKEFLTEDEYVIQLGMEKHHRFTNRFPATYMMLQWLHKSESDMFGRHLSGNGGSATSLPTGDDSFNAVTIAFQQPSPTLRWRGDLAFLIDVNGGILIQPGLRYKPNRELTVEAFATILESDGGNDDIIETIEYADEVSLRLSYQF